jgi:hypothetical protein
MEITNMVKTNPKTEATLPRCKATPKQWEDLANEAIADSGYWKREAREAQGQRDALLVASRRLIRWVGKGIADGSFNECVLPKAAESDMNFAQAAISRCEASRPSKLDSNYSLT